MQRFAFLESILFPVTQWSAIVIVKIEGKETMDHWDAFRYNNLVALFVKLIYPS